jgi:hypothetical protein
MWYVISFVLGLGIGAALVELLRRKNSGDTPSPEVIKKIVERSIEAYKQNKKTEEIIAEIDDLLQR